MGTVYRAHDPRLGRDVAIKVVKAVFAGDSERAARFDREARLLASLNHPHVAVVHGLEESGGVRFLVLELVEGVTLSERLREGPLSVRETLRLALQIALAIEAAHDRNIIHRDLKPANIKITPGGDAKVLDFGLAKALAIDSAALAFASQNPTLSAGGTGEGVILGTAAYMSPEQARGKDVDKRTDIWSFGCVLYDMLTARHAFPGDTLSDTLAAILTREPDWSLLPPDLPAPIRRLLRRLLEKDVNRRLRDIGDARFEIEEALSASSDALVSAGTASERVTTPGVSGRRVTAVAGSALLLAAALGAILAWHLWRERRPPATPTVQFTVPMGAGDRLAEFDFHTLAIAPDDSHLAYVASRRGRSQLFLRALAGLEAQPLPGTDNALNPFFSPDGEWIAFFAGGKLRKISIRGGSVREIADAELGLGGTWMADGTIIFAPSNASPLVRVSADGGTPVAVTTLDTSRREFSHRWPEALPGGKNVLFTIGTVGSWDDADIAVQSLEGGERRILMEGGTFPRYAPPGYLLYTRHGSVYSVPFDARAKTLTGEAVAITEGVLESVDGAAQFALSPRGSAVYVTGGTGAGRTLFWVDREGNVQPLAAGAKVYSAPRLSPDGRSLALAVGPDPEQIYTYSIAENRLTQLSSNGGSCPVWSRDGHRIYFSSARGGPSNVFVTAADGTGVEQRLTRSDRAQMPHAVLPTDGGLLLVELSPSSGRDISILSGDGTTRPLIATAANESAPAVSPDGKALAFVSDESGQPEVYVASLNDVSRHARVSEHGGTEPVWKRDGTELFFRSGNLLMAVSLRQGLVAGPPRRLFEGQFQAGSIGSPAYDVSTDGTRFLMLKAAATTAERELRVVLGFSGRLPQ